MPAVGDVLGGKYRILRTIGDGGMGTVYEARHDGLGISVALKFLHADLTRVPGLSSRFLREARVAASVQSPHVARVTDVDTTPEGTPYLVMELLSGESLQSLLDREHKLAPERAVEFALQILSGLAALHSANVVHRDLKPDNVFVTPKADGPVLKLLDFGIAKTLEPVEGQRPLTRSGAVMGTPEYMPPEQLYSAGEVDPRADLYALGVILFEMLSGRRPAEGDDAQIIVSRILSGDVLDLGTLEPTLPSELVAVVRRATLADRDARFASAEEMRRALAPFSGSAPSSPAVALANPQAWPSQSPPHATRRDSSHAPPEPVSERGSTEPAAPPVLSPWRVERSPVVSAPAPRRRRRAWWYVLSVLVLGMTGAAVVIFVVEPGRSRRTIPPLPTFTPPVETSTTIAPLGQAPPLPPAPTLDPPTPLRPPAPGPGPRPATDAGTNTDSGTPFPLPTVPPVVLPSTFPPLPLPSGFPSTLPSVLPPLPSGFPQFPGLGLPRNDAGAP